MTTREPPRAPSRLARIVRLGLPLGVSLGVHGAVVTLLVGVAWTIHVGDPRGEIGAPITIAVEAPRPLILPGDAAPEIPAPSGAPLDPASVPAPPLTGLVSGSSAQAPALISAVPEVDESQLLLRSEPPAATFAGLGARRAESVVYAVDASGAMVTNLKWVLQELERSVAALSPAQRFQVILFRDRPGAGGRSAYDIFRPDAGPLRLVPATVANRAALAAWLADTRPGGRSNPLDGLRRAVEFQPDVVFLLSRSIPRTGGEEQGSVTGDWSRGPQAILEELETLNPRRLGGARRVVIKTIQFLEDDPTGAMQAIARDHGDGRGSYAVLTLDQLRDP